MTQVAAAEVGWDLADSSGDKLVLRGAGHTLHDVAGLPEVLRDRPSTRPTRATMEEYK